MPQSRTKLANKHVARAGPEDYDESEHQWTIAALIALAAVTVHTLHAQAIGPISIAHDSDAAGSIHSKTYADWQGPLTQSFGIRFLARRTAWDPIAGAPPSRGFSLQIFNGLDKMQVWHDVP